MFRHPKLKASKWGRLEIIIVPAITWKAEFEKQKSMAQKVWVIRKKPESSIIDGLKESIEDCIQSNI